MRDERSRRVAALKQDVGPGDSQLTGLLKAASDIALILDRDGIVREIAVEDEDLAREIGGTWLGQPMLDTVTPESRGKVHAMLASRDGAVIRQEINHTLGDGDLPVRYAAVRLSPDGPVAVLGRDLRDIARLQQQLVDASLTAERDYALQRATEIQFRVLLQNASDAVVIADATTRRIGTANPAAEDLLGRQLHRLSGTDLASLFAGEDARALQDGFVTARTLGHMALQRLALKASGRAVAVAGWLIRSSASPQVLLRFDAPREGAAAAARDVDMWAVLDHVPEPVLIVDADLAIVAANDRFLDLVGAATAERVRGEPLGRFLGRHGVDLGTLTARTGETGSIRNFETAVRTVHGIAGDVDVSVAAFERGGDRLFCVLLRAREGAPPPDGKPLLRAADEMASLVGRKSLRDIVRETVEIIEELCIETALKLTDDNRASAADMLGLSRQGLYDKLRRYGLGDLPGDEGQ